MKVKLLHGTSADNLKSILKNGLSYRLGQANWTCSSMGVYFWDERILDGDTEEDKRREAFMFAADSAEFALGRAKDCRRVVIEVELDDDEISNDTSCNNMDGAVVTFGDVPASAITNIWRDAEDLSLFRPYFLVCRLDRELAVDLEMSEIELAVAKMAKDNVDYCCQAGDFLSEALDSMKKVRFNFRA